MTTLKKWLHQPWVEAVTDGGLLVLIAIIGVLDVMSGSQIRLTAFFLIPIMLLTWRRGIVAGTVGTLAALAFLLWIEYKLRIDGLINPTFALDMAGRFVAFFVNVGVLAQLRKLYLQQKQIATRDPLTQLHNRLGWCEIVGVGLEKARREASMFGVLFLDCDNFKAVNDRLGHGVGDQLLKTVAHVLHDAVRSSDVTCRLGGDEFLAYFDRLGAPELVGLASKIKRELDAAMATNAWPVTFSIGSVLFEQVPASVDELLRIADGLMYEAKKAGKDSLRSASWHHDGLIRQ